MEPRYYRQLLATVKQPRVLSDGL
eukprot:COSAG02_NODE_68887_length_214_cov_97.643478_1_plen_23_part_10